MRRRWLMPRSLRSFAALRRLRMTGLYVQSPQMHRSRLRRWRSIRAMKKSDFDELIGSVREAGKILRSERKPNREFVFAPEDVQAIRKKALGRH